MDCVWKACQLHIPASVLLACVYDVCCVSWGGTRQGWSLARLAIGGHCQALPRSMWPWASFARATCHSVCQCYQALLAAQWSGEQLTRSQTLTHQPWPSHPHWPASNCIEWHLGVFWAQPDQPQKPQWSGKWPRAWRPSHVTLIQWTLGPGLRKLDNEWFTVKFYWARF